MHLPISLLFAASAVVSPVLGGPTSRSSHKTHHDEVIERDVVIIGGGATGTYAAVQLQDRNKSVMVVEKAARLGGRGQSAYFRTGHMDTGVVAVFNNTLTRDYLKRLDVPFQNTTGAINNTFYDFKTGAKQPGPKLPPVPQLAAMYEKVIANFSYTATGTFDFPKPIPEELLQPFKSFVDSHQELVPILPLIYSFAAGVGNVLEAPLLYVLQTISKVHVESLRNGILAPTHGIASLYDRAAQTIGEENILYHSTVQEVVRSPDGVTVTVEGRGEGGEGGRGRKIIKAKKLLVTMAPMPSNMKVFDLDEHEKDLFSKFHWSNQYVAVVANSGIPDGIQVTNLDPTQPFSLPVPPVQWSMQYFGASGYLASKVIGDMSFTAQQAKEHIIGDLQRLNGSFAINPNFEVLNFDSHVPTDMSVSVDDVRNGFYDKLYALQGEKNTFYTGHTFCSDYSSVLWNYTETVMAKMF